MTYFSQDEKLAKVKTLCGTEHNSNIIRPKSGFLKTRRYSLRSPKFVLGKRISAIKSNFKVV